MKRYNEEDYLMLSGIQHYIFCKRQWALIHIEQQWNENYRTVDGRIMHQHAHDDTFREKRGDTIITRAMAVSSPWLGVSGECDVVEFQRDDNGVNVSNLDGKYKIVPIEYKRGEPKPDLSDKMQLAAQALCLEDMLCCSIPEGYLYYGETKHRLKVEIDDLLREETKKTVSEMHQLFDRGYTPIVKRSKSCNACSLKDICLPALAKKKNAQEYIINRLKEDDNEKTT